jgi:low affinity Fe/Cu permease
MTRSAAGKNASVTACTDGAGNGASNGKHPLGRLFGRIAETTSREVGRAWVFALAVGTIMVWAITGPFFGFSDTWQLVINTGTTIVTFLMVFLIQNAQNRDGAAIQVKLNELIRVSKVNNSFVGVEHLTEEELEEIRAKCESRAKTESAPRAGVKTVNGNHAGGRKRNGAKSAAH